VDSKVGVHPFISGRISDEHKRLSDDGEEDIGKCHIVKYI
jgi:hypothetical protein